MLRYLLTSDESQFKWNSLDENQPLTTVGINFAFDEHCTTNAHAAKNGIFLIITLKRTRVCTNLIKIMQYSS